MPPDMLGAVEGAVDGAVGLDGVSGSFSGSGSGSGVGTRSGVRSGVSTVDGRDGCVGVESRLGGAVSSRRGVVCGLWDGGFACWFGFWF